MTSNGSRTTEKIQGDKFMEAARAAECDEDEGRCEERLRKVARQKPSEDKPG